MSRDKQIEEMADVLCNAKEHDCKGGNDCLYVKQAKALYNAGYRKASDVVREIFEEIEKRISALEYQANSSRKTVKIEELKAQVDWILHEVVPQTIAELKKKYTEGEG